jgi:PRC-barrel domain
MNSNLRYLAASRVDTPIGGLRDAVVLSPSDEQLGKLNGIVVDPQERRLCYFVVESGLWRKQHLVPAGFARVGRDSKALYVDVERDHINQCEEFRSGRLPSFSDEDLITALFPAQPN